MPQTGRLPTIDFVAASAIGIAGKRRLVLCERNFGHDTAKHPGCCARPAESQTKESSEQLPRPEPADRGTELPAPKRSPEERRRARPARRGDLARVRLADGSRR